MKPAQPHKTARATVRFSYGRPGRPSAAAAALVASTRREPCTLTAALQRYATAVRVSGLNPYAVEITPATIGA
jgi:hypothetical protein